MSLSIGIVGLPNVGKSTLFNALLKKQIADVSNYPFCTIRPNQGVVEVPDERLDRLASSLNLSKKIPAVVKFIDIAGLVKGAYKGEGLGNQFLAHIRQCDALIEVVRFFGDKEITGVVDPESDIEVIKTELTLKDLETVKKYLDKVKKETKTGDKKTQEEIKLLEKIQGFLDQDKMISEMDLSDDEKEELIKSLCLLTAKPILLIANVSERSLRKRYKELESKGFVPVSAKLEAELTELSNKEAQQYLEELGLKELGLNRLIKKAYNLLSKNYTDWSFEDWKKGYQNTLYIVFLKAEQVEDKENTVFVKFYSADLKDEQFTERFFEGEQRVEKYNEQWKLEEANIKEIENPDWLWFYE